MKKCFKEKKSDKNVLFTQKMTNEKQINENEIRLTI